MSDTNILSIKQDAELQSDPSPRPSPRPSPDLARLRGLYVVTDAGALDAGALDSGAIDGHLAMATAALSGGAKIIQLRDKTATSRELLRLAIQLRALTNRHDALLIINDRADIALASGADGVHLGDDDLPIAAARRIVGDKFIGISCGSVEQAQQAQFDGADYIGVGAIFGTQTKLDAGAPIGLEILREIVNSTSLPVAAIGGITLKNIAEVTRCGAPMVCVVSAISRAQSAQQMTEKTRELLAATRFEN